MPIKINILKYDSPKVAARSIALLEAKRSIPDSQKLTNARIIRHIASVSMKRAASPSDRANFKKVVSIYNSYISKLEQRIRLSGG